MTGEGEATPLDVLLLINFLNRTSGGPLVIADDSFEPNDRFSEARELVVPWPVTGIRNFFCSAR